MVCPPFSIIEGKPAQIVGERPESTSTVTFSEAVARYKSRKCVSKSEEEQTEENKKN